MRLHHAAPHIQEGGQQQTGFVFAEKCHPLAESISFDVLFKEAEKLAVNLLCSWSQCYPHCFPGRNAPALLPDHHEASVSISKPFATTCIWQMTGPGSNVKRPNKTECQQGFLRSDRHHCKRIRKLNQRSELSNQETHKRVGHALCDGSVSKAKARKMHSRHECPFAQMQLKLVPL